MNKILRDDTYTVTGLKKSSPVHTTTLKLIKKYHQQSQNLPKTKKKLFSCKINQFNDWTVPEFQKWLRTAKRVIHKNEIANKSLNHRRSQLGQQNRKAKDKHEIQYKHKIIRATSIIELNKRKETNVTNCFIRNINHRYEEVSALKLSTKHDTNNIISTKQGTMKID